MKDNQIRIRMISVGYMLSLALVLFPLFSNLYQSWTAQRQIAAYDASVCGLTDEQRLMYYEEAVSYNNNLAVSGSSDGYDSVLDFAEDGMMGYLVIPKIDVNLPVFHGTDGETLLHGVGHLESSSLPVGGESSHSVLTAHRGLPGSRLFTCLDELENGDLFYIEILGRTFCYEVTGIQVVLPEETESLAIRSGEDLCTLVTCTPYGINSHRLLVTGSRTEFTPDETEAEGTGLRLRMMDYILILTAASETIVYLSVREHLRRHTEKSRKHG